jgi:ABC-type oligopeptide transport system ATPase subunit
MNLELNEFNLQRLDSKALCLILGDSGSGRSTLIKTIVQKELSPFISGIVCTDSKHSISFYPEFLAEKYIYKRYSSLLATRCYQDNSYLILDDDYYSKEKYNEIFENSQTKNMLLLVSLKKFTEFIDYNYIFILKYTNQKELYTLYQAYPYLKKNLAFEQFIHLVNTCTENDYSVLVFSCKARTLNDLFYLL